MNSGNRITKGNCCGGYNFNNEDFVSEMFTQGYPKHQIVSVTPYTMASSEMYSNFDTGRASILYGYFYNCWTNNINIDLEMIDMDGRLVAVFGAVVGERPGIGVPMAAIRVNNGMNDEIPNGWGFVGWQIEIIGPIIESSGLEIDFQAMIGGSYPASTPLDAAYNLQCLSPYWSIRDNVVALAPGATGGKFSIDAFRLEVEAGEYESYTIQEITRMFRMPEATVTVTEVITLTPESMRILFTITNLFNPVTVCTYLEDIAVQFTSGLVDILIVENSLQVQNELNQAVANVVIAGSSFDSSQGHIKGLAFVKDTRIIQVDIDNTSAFDETVYINAFGAAQTVLGTATPGYSQPTESVDLTNYHDNLWRQPAVQLSCGSPA